MCILILKLAVISTFAIVLFTMCSIIDVKIFGAYLSIFHMNTGTLAVLLCNIEGVLLIDFVWVIHSLSAMKYFWTVGIFYSFVGARNLQSVISCLITPISLIILIMLLLINIGCPVGLFFVIEVCLLSNLTCLIIGAFICIFCISVYVFVVVHVLLKYILIFDVRRVLTDYTSASLYVVILFLFIISAGIFL